MKFVDVFQFFNYLLEEMSRCNCFSLQLVGGGLVGRRSDWVAQLWCLLAIAIKYLSNTLYQDLFWTLLVVGWTELQVLILYNEGDLSV